MPAATASPKSKSSASGQQKTLRLAFIGAGGIANAHLSALERCEDVEVVALADIDEKPMDEKVERFGIDKSICYSDYQKMLDDVKPDAVSVCTPNGVHCPATIAAAKAGAHIIVEKPMAMSSDEARQMQKAATDNGVKLVIGFQYRFDAKTSFLCAQREAGVFGDIRFGRVQALRRRGIPNWGVFGQKHLQGGGPMIDIGVHVLEMCHFTMGSPKPVAAVGMTETYMGNREEATKTASEWAGWDWATYTVEDMALGHIRFDNGAVIHIEATFAAHHDYNGKMDFEIMGTQGGARWGSSEVFTDMNGYMMNLTPAYLPKEGGMGNNAKNYFYMKLRNFVDHVLYDTPTTAPAEHGVMVQQMLEAIYRSADNGGKEVEITS